MDVYNAENPQLDDTAASGAEVHLWYLCVCHKAGVPFCRVWVRHTLQRGKTSLMTPTQTSQVDFSAHPQLYLSQFNTAAVGQQ